MKIGCRGSLPHFSRSYNKFLRELFSGNLIPDYYLDLTQDRLEPIPDYYLDLTQDRLELIPDYYLPHPGSS